LKPRGTFDPATLKLLGRAFDEVWQDIGGNHGVASAEDRRTRFALRPDAWQAREVRAEIKVLWAAVKKLTFP
jgi:hypothetical protein